MASPYYLPDYLDLSSGPGAGGRAGDPRNFGGAVGHVHPAWVGTARLGEVMARPLGPILAGGSFFAGRLWRVSARLLPPDHHRPSPRLRT